MGFRAMVSPTRGQAPHFPPLARQGSLYNLTLDEVQNQLGDLGKPLNSMNLDELLKSVVAVEENADANTNVNASSSAPLLPANLNLSRTLSRKTVDEMWKETVQEEQGNASSNVEDGSVQRQPTLGEMTLEDFLLRARAINRDITNISPQQLMAADALVSAMQPADWLQYHPMAVVHQPQMAVLGSGLSVPPPVFGRPSVDVGFSENQLAMTMVGAASSDSQAAVERKRQLPDEMMEKSIERRQKRMIKNRESAARSRARKQANTNQLEQEVSRLRKTNWRLKKQKELEMLLPLNQTTEPKYQLRRTSSSPF